MKIVLKITMILIILLVGFGSVSKVYADPTGITDSWSTMEDAREIQKKYEDESKTGDIYPDSWNPSQTSSDNILKFKANIVATVIRTVGIIISVIALMIIGFRNMIASVEEKSVIKQALPGYILGIIMTIAVSVIPTIIYELVK